MPSMKCVSCGIVFFSQTEVDKCSQCMEKDPYGMEHDHDSCGCGHSH